MPYLPEPSEPGRETARRWPWHRPAHWYRRSSPTLVAIDVLTAEAERLRPWPRIVAGQHRKVEWPFCSRANRRGSERDGDVVLSRRECHRPGAGHTVVRPHQDTRADFVHGAS